jgi:hypothetical protein
MSKKAATKTIKSKYRPSPPSAAGDRLDLQLKSEIESGFVQASGAGDFMGVEVIIRAMRFSFSQVGDRAFKMYDWSPHSAVAIAQVKLEQRIEEDCEF